MPPGSTLPVGIVAGQSAHIQHHNLIHGLLDGVNTPFDVGSLAIVSDLAALGAISPGQGNRLAWVSNLGALYFDDTSAWVTAGAADAAVVHKAGAETITGAKDFTGALTKSGVALETTTGAAAKVATETADRQTADALLIPLTQRAAASGVATLDAGTKVPSAQISEVLATTNLTDWPRTAALDLAGQKLTNLGDGSAVTDGVSFGQLSAVSTGVSFLDPSKWSTTANIALTGLGTQAGGEWTGALTAGDRVLAKNQTTTADDGVYTAAAGAWTRATDADTAAEITKGATTFVENGAVHQGDQFTQRNIITTLGTDAQSWSKTGHASTYIADESSLRLVGSTFSAKPGGITNSLLNADVFSAAHTWTAAQTFSNGIVAGSQKITSLAAGVAGTDATNLAQVTAAITAAIAAATSTYDPRSYGAVADGTLHRLSAYYGTLGAAQAVYPFATSLSQSIDWAGFQKAVLAAEAAGGGEVVITKHLVLDGPNDFTVNAAQSGWCVAIFIQGDNITLTGRAGHKIEVQGAPPQTASVLIAPWGVWRRGFDVANWYPNRPMVAITAAALKGATAVSVASAAGLSVGDVVFLRTGQTIVATPELQPDSEINIISAIAGTTINMLWPLSKDFRQEYYVAGTSGVTSTTVNANPAPFGLHKVTDCTMRNFVARDLNFDTPAGTAFFNLIALQCIGFTAENITGRYWQCAVGSQYTRNWSYERIHMEKDGATDVVSGAYIIGAATGCNDGFFEDIKSWGDGPVMAHFHEGVTGVVGRGLSMKHIGSNLSPITDVGLSITGRAYGFDISDVEVIGATNAGCVFVGPDCVAGGSLRNLRLTHPFPGATYTGSIVGVGWTVENVWANLPLLHDGSTNMVTNQIIDGLNNRAVNKLGSRFSIGTIVNALDDVSATPSIAPRYTTGQSAQSPIWAVDSVAPRTISHLTDATDGEIIFLYFGTVTATLQDQSTGGRFFLKAKANITPALGAFLMLYYQAVQDAWFEIGRT